MIETDRNLLIEFANSIDTYKKLDERVNEIICKLIADNNFFVMDVSHRIKTVDSLKGKLKKKSGKYKKLTDITDLCGVRIICYFADTVDKLADKLTEVFDVDADNSIDKRKMWEANAFGYLSLHYICSIPGDEDICNIPFEIQIRTVLQHAWAEIEHDLGYKSQFGVPRAIRRDFSRLAGLLELADKEFLAVRENTHSYNTEVHEKIISGETDDVSLDFVSLSEFVKFNKFFKEIEDKLIQETGVEIEYIEPDKYIKQLEWLGIKTISDLSKILQNRSDDVCNVMIHKIKEFELDITSTNMILRYFCRAVLIFDDYSEDLIRQFLAINDSNQQSIDYQVRNIMGIKNHSVDIEELIEG